MTSTTKRVGLATCSVLPDLDSDDRPLVKALAERGVQAEPTVWDDEDVDWEGYDLVVVRSTWDYSPRRDEFVEWARRVPNLANPADVIAWNTDKRYLRELEEAGVPVIPTIWLEPEKIHHKRAIHTRLPAFGDFVVKPVVSAGAKDTGRYQPVNVESRAQAIMHAQRLLSERRSVMIQPYVTSVDTAGETGLVFIDETFQHATRKNALLAGHGRPTRGLYAEEKMSAVTATPEQVTLAEKTIAASKAALGLDDALLYARIDVVTGDDGAPMVIEAELTEPSLWMHYSGDAPTLERLADAIVARA